MKRSAPVEENEERKDEKRLKEEEEQQVRRFGGKPDRAEEDDDDLAPEGLSDTEPEKKWAGESAGEYDDTALEVPSLAIEDFAGRYEIEHLETGPFHEINKPQPGRAYVEITKTGEGRYYIDRSLSGYFSLEHITQVGHEKHVAVHWRKSLMSCEYGKRKSRKAEQRDEDEDEDEDEFDPKNVYTGSVFFWDDGREANPSSKDQLRVMMMFTENDGGSLFVLRRIQTADGDPIVRVVSKRVRRERTIDEDGAYDGDDSEGEEEEGEEEEDDEDEDEVKSVPHRGRRDRDDDDDDDDEDGEKQKTFKRVVRRSAPDADDLVPEGQSDAEPNWRGPSGEIPFDSVYDPSLAVADFAGRYEVIHIEAGEDGDSKIINKKRAYVDITPTGEGKFYLDKSVNGYFSLEKIVHDQKGRKKSSVADVHWTKGKLMRQYQKKMGHRYEDGDDGEDTETHPGDIFFSDDSKQNVTLMMREETEYEDGMGISLKKLPK